MKITNALKRQSIGFFIGLAGEIASRLTPKAQRRAHEGHAEIGDVEARSLERIVGRCGFSEEA